MIGEDVFESDVLDEYCVKLGRYIPGGCDQEVCYDIDHCPYCPDELSLN